MKSNIFFALLFLVFVILGACGQTLKYPLSEKDISLSDINVYIAGTKINFVTDTIDKFNMLLGKPIRSQFIGENQWGKQMLDSYNGITIKYFKESGELLDVDISRRDISIIGNIRVGDSKKNILEKLTGRGTADEERYLFVRIADDKSYGTGYFFTFDKEEILTNIEVSKFPFGP